MAQLSTTISHAHRATAFHCKMKNKLLMQPNKSPGHHPLIQINLGLEHYKLDDDDNDFFIVRIY